ncbi:hypothetical protein J6590_048606 [Homalodisca vitripennis]|nr:hypothetical protein J6590_048606 [Homalodisca vitripennis]
MEYKKTIARIKNHPPRHYARQTRTRQTGVSSGVLIPQSAMSQTPCLISYAPIPGSPPIKSSYSVITAFVTAEICTITTFPRPATTPLLPVHFHSVPNVTDFTKLLRYKHRSSANENETFLMIQRVLHAPSPLAALSVMSNFKRRGMAGDPESPLHCIARKHFHRLGLHDDIPHILLMKLRHGEGAGRGGGPQHPINKLPLATTRSENIPPIVYARL